MNRCIGCEYETGLQASGQIACKHGWPGQCLWCPNCYGYRKVYKQINPETGDLEQQEDCHVCKGIGRVELKGG